MILNYLTIAWRNLRKRIGPTVINVVGLSVGLAACLLLGLWVRHEFSYDDFHPEADRVYRVAVNAKISGQNVRRGAATPMALGPALRQEIPEVESVTRFMVQEQWILRTGDRSMGGNRMLRADSSFFDVFGGFRLLHGSRETALDGTNRAVLTASTAQRIFGRTEVVGESFSSDGVTWEVSGVMADPPETSHLQFEGLVTLQNVAGVWVDNWTGFAFHTYVKLQEKASAAAMHAKFDQMTTDYVAPQLRDRFDLEPGQFVWQFVPRPITDIHLFSTREAEIEPPGSITTVAIMSAIALFILLIACINFMNLATARASERATEVGMRKALGAGQRQLAGQFLGEAVLTTTVAAIVAGVAASLALPWFNGVAGTSLSSSDLLDPASLGFGLGLVGVVGLIAGSYPAFVLSRFAPAAVLKAGRRSSSSGQGRRLRQGLVVFQFAISIVLIVGTLVAQEQFEYIQTKRLGIEKERVVEIEQTSELGQSQSTFIEQVEGLSGVTLAAAGDGLFGGIGGTAFYDVDNAENGMATKYLQVGSGFVETLGVEVVRGRAFDRARSTDTTVALANRAAVEAFGWDDPIGRRVAAGDTLDTYEIVGVVDDFHYESMRSEVDPLFLLMEDPIFGGSAGSVYIRLASGSPIQILDRVRNTWESMTSDPFEYAFVDQTYGALHRDVRRTGTLFSLFGGLAVLIACLGLFGLATYTVQRRAKEIGIRKTLGATSAQVVGLVSREFLQLVGLACIVALPVAYVVMRQWLQDFAYRTDLGPGLFAGAVALAGVVALVAVSYQSLRAATLDPASTLKDE